ncbi:MAG: phage head closure protein [Hyphomicrobiaceae bacterium]
MSTVPIGAMRQRIVLEAAVRSGDGGGGAIVSWAPVAEMWASVAGATGDETVLGEGLAGSLVSHVSIRYRTDIEPSMRFRLGARLLEIIAVHDVDGRRRRLSCRCRERPL